MKALRILSLVVLFFALPALSADLEVKSIGVQAFKPLATDFHSYNFGRIWVNSSQSVVFNVTNTGNTPLNFSGAYISGMGYDAYHNCLGTLQVREQCSFEIRYWPMFEGLHSGRFTLSFQEDAHVVVNLWGEAYRP